MESGKSVSVLRGTEMIFSLPMLMRTESLVLAFCSSTHRCSCCSRCLAGGGRGDARGLGGFVE